MKYFACARFPNIRILVEKEDTYYDEDKGGVMVKKPARYAEFKNKRLTLEDDDKKAIDAIRNHRDFGVFIQEVDVKSAKKTSKGAKSESDSDGQKYTRGMSSAK